MTTTEVLTSLSDIVADLSRELPPKVRFQRLLDALMSRFPCDATALLQLEGEYLVPRAVRGLSPETMGRRFLVKEQPRLMEIVNSRNIVRFPSASSLPDPYDGLVDGEDHHLYVHDCMGASLQVDGKTWGVLTLDALAADRFDNLDMALLETFISIAAATIRAADLIQRLESNLERHQLAQEHWLSDSKALELLGESAVMKRLRREAEIVGQSNLLVLVNGETGVGKELFAHFIHLHSPRMKQPLVQINCAALSENLVESELFGHVSGAFSGANKDRAGKFELADGGTLFLDEVGELPLQIQAKLLRAIQSGEIQRVGSDENHQVDVRIIAATNRNLEQEVREGRFRADLFHRLSVYPLTVPPLRERGKEDIALIAGHFLQVCEKRFGLRAIRLHAEAQAWMRSYTWPGNVRELENAISRAVVKAISEGLPANRVVMLNVHHLGGAQQTDLPTTLVEAEVLSGNSTLSMSDALLRFKRELIVNRLKACQNNKSRTAKSLGMDKGNFHRLLLKLGISG
ncbi:MAG: nitric oxide reductase transcriptional regulator NorR [Pseudomonadales bacterium]|nr:nitric oxide reductase transcriptional regulator NorR [Pseudomonadales bacterium]MCP5357374.1 nitric oxide reductase transcriptional regulator NorR [Pseudomonadales bacterium]